MKKSTSSSNAQYRRSSPKSGVMKPGSMSGKMAGSNQHTRKVARSFTPITEVPISIINVACNIFLSSPSYAKGRTPSLRVTIPCKPKMDEILH